MKLGIGDAVTKGAEAGHEVYKAINRTVSRVSHGAGQMKDDAIAIVDAYKNAPESKYGIPMNVRARKQLKELEDSM
jgi:hypothetical protein